MRATSNAATGRDSLEVCELFVSIAGESSLAGVPAFFIRLAGCNLDCRWCDTPRARKPGRIVPVADLLDKVRSRPYRHVVVTGGEPLRQAACPLLMHKLLEAGRLVMVETNGSLPIEDLPAGVRVIMDFKPPASGQMHRMREENLDHMHAGDDLKLVIAERADFDWALDWLARHELRPGVNILLSPAFQQLEPALLAEWMLQSGIQARLQIQMHRAIWPDGRDGWPID